MFRIPSTRTQLVQFLTLGLLIAASTGCVMGPTDQVVLSDHETVYGFPIFGFVDPPPKTRIQLSISPWRSTITWMAVGSRHPCWHAPGYPTPGITAVCLKVTGPNGITGK